MLPADWRRRLRFVSAAVLLLAAAGCDASSTSGPAAAPKGKRSIESNDGRYVVELETVPGALAVNQPFDVTLSVSPKDGSASDLEVQVDARMPAHFHGMNRMAKMSRAGSGWKAEGLVFHMPGHWELYVDITRGGWTERAQMDVELK
jgi:hypothetical protein